MLERLYEVWVIGSQWWWDLVIPMVIFEVLSSIGLFWLVLWDGMDADLKKGDPLVPTILSATFWATGASIAYILASMLLWETFPLWGPIVVVVVVLGAPIWVIVGRDRLKRIFGFEDVK